MNEKNHPTDKKRSFLIRFLLFGGSKSKAACGSRFNAVELALVDFGTVVADVGLHCNIWVYFSRKYGILSCLYLYWPDSMAFFFEYAYAFDEDNSFHEITLVESVHSSFSVGVDTDALQRF